MRLLAPKTVTLVCGAIFFVAAPLVAGPVLHERFEPNPAEDLRLGATTPSGSMPAAIETPSGMVLAPDESHDPRPEAASALYGGHRTPKSADANYYIDGLTTSPQNLAYDEPFRPSTKPFKRLYAFDLIRPDLSFGVRQSELTRVTVGGLANKSEDAFFADFEVDLVDGVAVRIPSVGPGARIRAMHMDPPGPMEVLEDGAENWFARGHRTGRARLVMQLSIERQSFGSQFRPVSWGALAAHVAPVPAEAKRAATEVAARVGVSRSLSPAGALLKLVSYFRTFSESSELPHAKDAIELYKELSFSRKGVCRHRSYAFVITAQALGLPARLVHNEAHAWVEVYDTDLWHRVDLGGAPANLVDSRNDPLRPNHRPPSDPYSWPSESRPASSYAQMTPALFDDPAQNGDEAPEQEPRDLASSGWPGAQASTNADDQDRHRVDRGAVPEVILKLAETQLLRGRPLPVSGTAKRGEQPCALARVDISIADGAKWITIGSVATDRKGHFEGHVTVPQVTPVGALQVSANVAGGCE